MLAPFVLAAYTSPPWLHTLYYYERCSSGLLGHRCMIASPDRGIPQQVRMLLLVTLRRTNVLARLFLDSITHLKNGWAVVLYILAIKYLVFRYVGMYLFYL